MTGSTTSEDRDEADATWLAVTFLIICTCVVSALLLAHYSDVPLTVPVATDNSHVSTSWPVDRTAEHAP